VTVTGTHYIILLLVGRALDATKMTNIAPAAMMATIITFLITRFVVTREFGHRIILTIGDP
jgi:hypothetical protein